MLGVLALLIVTVGVLGGFAAFIRHLARLSRKGGTERSGLMGQWLGLPVSASEHAPSLDFMNEVVHWMMLVLFIGWGVFFVYTLFRFRRATQPEGGLSRRPQPLLDLDGSRGRRRRGRPARGVRHPGLGDARRGLAARVRSDGRPRGRRAVRVERPLSGAGRRVRLDEYQADQPGQSARARPQVDARR